MNIRDIGISKGLLTYAKKGIDFLYPIFKSFFNYFNIAYYDECCNNGEISKSGLPVAFNNNTNTIQYYNPITKSYTDTTTNSGSSGDIIILSQLGNPYKISIFEEADGSGVLTTTKL